MVWRPTCKGCNKVIRSWVTYHQEGDDRWVAYCYECDDQDPFTYDEKGKAHWTLRVRCSHLFDDWTQCENTWQSCRDKGSSQHVKCLNWWGWKKSCRNRWLCPEHAEQELAPQLPVQTECKCSTLYAGRGIPLAAPPPGGAAPPAGPRELAEAAE